MKDILLIGWDLKSIKHWIIFFTKTSRLYLCLLATLSTNEFRQNIKSFNDLLLIVNSEGKHPNLKHDCYWGTVGAFIPGTQYVSSSSVFCIFIVMVILEALYIARFLFISLLWCPLVGKIPQFNIFPSRQVLKTWFYFHRKDMKTRFMENELQAQATVWLQSGPTGLCFDNFPLFHLTIAFVFCSYFVVGSFVHPIPYQIGNPSLSLCLPVPAETQFWTKSTKPYLYTSTGLETPEAEITVGGILWQIEAFEEDRGHVRFPIPDTRSEISLLFVKCLSAPDPNVELLHTPNDPCCF